MKRCLACGSEFASQDWLCPRCGWEPQSIAGFKAFAGELAGVGEGFPSEIFDDLARLESDHFWFRARNRLVLWAMRKYFPDARNFLEVGCGTGFVLAGVAESFPEWTLVGTELHNAGLAAASGRLPNAELIQADARRLPFAEEFELAGCFDVLEHVAEDQDVLAELFRAIRPGGGLMLTVPQHPWLWSRTDDYACHVRRYRRDDLLAKVEAAGFEVHRTTSFVTLLLPVMILARWRGRAATGDNDPLAELRLGQWTNRILEGVLSIEQLLLRRGVDLPVGGSLLLIARKPLS